MVTAHARIRGNCFLYTELLQNKESALYLFQLVLVGGMIKFDLHIASGNVSDSSKGTVNQATLRVKVSR